ncbi:MAG TPA: zinc-binding dehydrogenase [Thermoplasmata archaeon]|nr:zinc-binding dehydrogenase [Thermoplasmata archaeon]
MKGLGFREHGGLERVEFVDIPEPSAGPGEVRVRVRAAAFNRLDRFVLAGIPGVPIERPHVLGSDVAGEVDSLGPGVSDLPVGSRVLANPGIWDGTCESCRSGQESLCRAFRILGEHTQGSATEYVVLPRRNLYAIPPAWSFADAAAVPLVFQTAWRAIRTIGATRPGDLVAVIGAGGGVASAAVQVAKLLGARVAVTTRDDRKAERARSLGADEVLVTSPDRPIDRGLWEWSGKRGVDVVFDSSGRDTVPRSLKAIARGGRVVVIGATTGPLVELDLRTLFWRQASIRGSTMANSREFEEVLAELAAGRLRPVVDREYDFADGVEAIARIDSPELFGKVVLRGP